MANEPDQAGVRFPPPLVFLGFLLVGITIGAFTGRPGFGVTEPVRWAAAALLAVAGIALIVAAVSRFRSAGTAPEPWKPSSLIVDTGIYAHTRNPMYLAMAALHLGLAVMMDSLWGAAMLILALLVIRTQVIAREEAYLANKFGETYRAYQLRVRRWL